MRKVATVVTAGALIAAPAVMALPVQSAAAAPRYVDVSATQGWQQSSTSVHKGDGVSFWYEKGQWSVDKVNFPYVGPGGYSSDVDQKIYQGCKLDASLAYGVMLARVGDGPTITVGKRKDFVADQDGVVSFRIHDADQCLGDNDGTVRMEYSVTIPEPAPAPKPPPAPKPKCGPVLIGVHGVGEGPSDSVVDVSPTIANAAKSWKSALKGKKPIFYPVNYPTIPYPIVQDKNGLIKRTIFPDVQKGADELQKLVEATKRACGSPEIALVGYSEGAWVIDTWQFQHPFARRAVKAVQLYGDPLYENGKYQGLVPRGLSEIPDVWVQLVRALLRNVHMEYPVRSFCLNKDPVCGEGYTSTLQQLKDALAITPKSKGPHFGYAGQIADSGARWLAKHVK